MSVDELLLTPSDGGVAFNTGGRSIEDRRPKTLQVVRMGLCSIVHDLHGASVAGSSAGVYLPSRFVCASVRYVCPLPNRFFGDCSYSRDCDRRSYSITGTGLGAVGRCCCPSFRQPF